MNIPQVQTLISLLKLIPFTFFDYILLTVFCVYLIEEVLSGAKQALSNLISLVVSFLGGLFLYKLLSNLLIKLLSIPKGVSDASSFLLLAILLYIFCLRVFLIFFKKNELVIPVAVSKITAGIAAIFSFTLISSFILSLLLSFNVDPSIKSSIRHSFLGDLLFTRMQSVELSTRQIFGESIHETLNFLTLEEDEKNKTIQLHFRTTSVSVDEDSEKEMFMLIASERKKNNLSTLSASAPLIKLSRAYAKDMLEKGYFSHYTPDGLSPFDRLSQLSIPYTNAAENLAYAPDVRLAFSGLMKSPSHKKNILDSSFHKVGIGVIDAGIYGKMFVQEFTD